MADMNMPQKSGKRKLQTPRLDLTPMVDLGFLLITFFMYTTTLARPATMELNMPSVQQEPDPPHVSPENAITIIATKAHKLVYFEGALDNPSQLRQCAFSELRKVVLNKKVALALMHGKTGKAHNLFAFLKPADDCTYADLVQLLDEMAIDGIKFYSVADVSKDENEMFRKIF